MASTNKSAEERRKYHAQWRATHPANVRRNQLRGYRKQLEKAGFKVEGNVDELALAAMLVAQTVAEQDGQTIAQGDTEGGGQDD